MTKRFSIRMILCMDDLHIKIKKLTVTISKPNDVSKIILLEHAPTSNQAELRGNHMMHVKSKKKIIRQCIITMSPAITREREKPH